MRKTWLLVTLVIVWAASTTNFAHQQPGTTHADPQLTIATLQSFAPRHLGDVQWQDDGTAYFKLEPVSKGSAVEALVRFDAASGARTILLDSSKLVPPGASAPLDIESFQLTRDRKRLLIFTNSRRVWRTNTRGDYWLVDVERGTLIRKLGGSHAPASSLMFAKFSPDETRIGYVRANNLYVETVSNGRISQLTHDGTPHLVNGTFDWVYEEELSCRDGWRWSPDGQRIAYWQLDTSGVKEYRILNDTASLYPELTTFPYPKAGETNSAARIGIVKASGGKPRWLAIPGDPRQHYLPRMDWAASSREVVVQQLNRTQNTNIVILGDVQTGKVRAILTEHDDAWVDVGFGDAWESQGLAGGQIAWIDNGRRFLWVSERDGWRHIYSIARDGSDARCITPGDYDVIDVDRVDEAGGWVYFDASPENATQRYLFRVPLAGGAAVRLTPAGEPGTHRYSLAPRGDIAIHTYSRLTQVPVTDVIRLSDHVRLRTLVDNEALAARLAALHLRPAEFFKVDVGPATLDGWIIKPPDFDPSKRYPVLFFTYGEPFAQTVVDKWGPDMWHELLAQHGYVVISVDNRGTPAPKGRAWRKAIYRKMGVLNSEDQANAARAIAKWPFVDGSRIGIWGWSGGGSTSLNAIFRYPEVYRMAIAVAPVPDIHYYDSIYQERYCGLPQDHPDEYKQSSPITFAAQLKGALLIVHGTGDDNVHYQGTEALIDALVAAGKPFTMMAYPNRTHGLYEGPGTMQHLYGLLTSFVLEKL